MISDTVQSLRAEIISAETFRDHHTSQLRSMLQRYHGPSFRADRPGEYGDEQVENFAHQYVSLVLPRIIHDQPRFKVSCANTMTDLLIGKRMELAINRWCGMTGIRRTLSDVATDMIFVWGVTMTVSEPRKEARAADGKAPYLPRVYRIGPERFFIDPAATSIENARYMGHCYAIDKDDLIERAKDDPTWDLEAVERLATGGDLDQARDDEGRLIEDRNEVVVYEVWVPELTADEDLTKRFADGTTNGTLFTLTKSQVGDTDTEGFIRRPVPYFGPMTGPYDVFGVYTVPDDPYPMSPMVAVDSQNAELNKHLASMSASAAAYKRLIMVDARNSSLAKNLIDKRDLFVVASEGLDKDRVLNLEVGGITGQQVQYSQIAQDRLDRASGMHDAMRGNVTGNATATEVSVAESASTMRMAHLKRQFQDAVSSMARKVLWYMWHDDRISMPLGRDGVKALLEVDPVFTGGVKATGWEDVSVTVDSYSMERVSEALQQKRSLEMLQIITIVAQAAVAAPFVKWRELLEMIGNANNMPGLGDMIDTDQAQNMMQQQAQQQQAPGLVTPASDTGSLRMAANR